MHTNGWEIIEIQYSYSSINCKGLSHLEILKSLHVSLVWVFLWCCLAAQKGSKPPQGTLPTWASRGSPDRDTLCRAKIFHGKKRTDLFQSPELLQQGQSLEKDEKKCHIRWQPADVALCRPDGKGEKVLIQYFFLSSLVSPCTCNLQLKAVPFFTDYVFSGTLESFTHSIKETITTVTYNVIICAVEFASIIKHLPCF